MIEYAKKSDLEELKSIYNICFPHEEEFCEYFFEKYFDSINVLVYRVGGRIAGMAAEIEYFIEGFGAVTYLYSVATLPEYRGRGICGALLEKSHENDVKKGRAVSVLIPADEGLFEFYGGLGYKKAFYIDEKAVFAKNFSGKLKECSAAEMAELYEYELRNILHIKRNEDYFLSLIDMYKRFGGGCFGLYLKDRLCGYCFYSLNDGKITFDEIMGNENIGGKALKSLGLSVGTAKMPFGGKPFGMAYFYGKEKADMYMNLMFN